RNTLARDPSYFFHGLLASGRSRSKSGSGSSPSSPAPGAAIVSEIEAQGFLPLDITPAHAQLAGTLPAKHRDPFDRVLVAQALSEGLPLVSNDELFDDYGVSRIW